MCEFRVESAADNKMRIIIKSNSPTKMSSVQPKAIQVVHGDENRRPDPREMQIVPVLPSIPHFELPDDWVVEVRPRGPNSSSKFSDKYYYEPGSGRQFRSLISVKRYLCGEEDDVVPRKRPCNSSSLSLMPYHNPGSFRRIAYGGKILRPDELEEARQATSDDIFPETLQFKSSSKLPDGWIVEEIPRACSFRFDRYFIDPVTGKRFRSIPEVEKYLAKQKDQAKCRALILKNYSTGPRSPSQRKKNTSLKMFRTSIVDLANPPEKINWVYSGDGKDNWKPLVEECVLPDYVKEQWAETFLLGMNGWKHRIPQLTMGKGNQVTNA